MIYFNRILNKNEFLSKDMQIIKLDQMRIDISNELALEENEQHNVPPCLGSIRNPLYLSHAHSVSVTHSILILIDAILHKYLLI